MSNPYPILDADNWDSDQHTYETAIRELASRTKVLESGGGSGISQVDDYTASGFFVGTGASDGVIRESGIAFDASSNVSQINDLAVGGNIISVGTVNGVNVGSPNHSITVSSNRYILVNDEASPGNNELYGTTSAGTKGWRPIPGMAFCVGGRDGGASSGANNYWTPYSESGDGTLGKVVIFPAAWGDLRIIGYYGQMAVDAYSSADIRFQVGKRENGSNTEAVIDADWGVSGTGNNQIVVGTADITVSSTGGTTDTGVYMRRRIASGTATTDDMLATIIVQFDGTPVG